MWMFASADGSRSLPCGCSDRRRQNQRWSDLLLIRADATSDSGELQSVTFVLSRGQRLTIAITKENKGMGFNPLKAVKSIAEKAVRVVAEPAKHIVNEVIDVGSDVGEHLGKGVRRVAGPFIGVIDDLHNALMPRLRFDLNVAGKFDANVTWPRTTDLDINLNLPGFPNESAPPAAMVGDLTGGFLSNITADRERLRSARRRLQLMRHIAQRGHRLGADDTFNVSVSYVPDDPWALADALETADALLPVFKVSVKEPGSQKHEYFVRVS